MKEASGPRRVADVPVGEPWREVLLRLSIETPIDVSIQELTRVFLEGLATVLPNLALGACVVADGAAPIVVTRLPSGYLPNHHRDPARLFPSLSEEHVIDLADGASGSTLHVACSPSTPALSPFHCQVSERAAQVLAALLARARAYQARANDGSALLELRAQLVQAEKLASLGQIVAGVVHELNNPLTSILAYADHLTTRVEAGELLGVDDAPRLRRISEAAERVLKFSRDLVAYARPAPEPAERLHLDSVIAQALAFCEHEFALHGVHVQKALAAEMPMVLGVAGQLTRVFVNLFTNAVHAMDPGGGVLRVSTARDDRAGALLIEVSDSGCGIRAEHLAQVFEPFFTTKTNGRGTGLGLSIVRDVVDAHGGTVSVQSTEGAGTTFLISLPVARPAV